MDVSIIIVNYNTLRLTETCIESIFSKTQGIEFEVIVVDNASTDDSRMKFSADRRIVYIYNHENLGFGRANNIGLKVAKGRNILFLNPDTLCLNNAIARLSTFLDSHPRAVAVGGNLYDEDMQPALSFRRQLPSIAWELDALLFHIPERIIYPHQRYFNHSIRPTVVGYITGADLMARREELLAVGGFAEEFFMYYEDTDLCFRLKRGGRRLYAMPDARIQHLEGRSFTKAHINHRRIVLSEQGRHLYYQRNHSRRYHIMTNIIYMASLALHSFYYKLSRQSIRRKSCTLRRRIVGQLQHSLRAQ